MKYEYEREEASATTKLTYLLIGGGIGAALALLFAPKSGHELRGDIADVTRKGIEKSKETAALVGERAGDYYEVTREKASELYQTAQEKAEQLGERAKSAAEQLGDKAKSVAAQTANPFTAAIEAGKEAYYEEKQRNEVNSIVEGRPSYPVEDKVLDAPEDSEN